MEATRDAAMASGGSGLRVLPALALSDHDLQGGAGEGGGGDAEGKAGAGGGGKKQKTAAADASNGASNGAAAAAESGAIQLQGLQKRKVKQPNPHLQADIRKAKIRKAASGSGPSKSE